MDVAATDINAASRWQYLDRLRKTRGPFNENTDISEENLANIDRAKILVIGAGGLGCEILKNIALTGFKDIHVIDMDTIDISNLNRQFLFRKSDVGKYKAEVAAAFVQQRVEGVKITPYNCRIQEFDESFYMQFQIVVCGLDSIEARRWINATLVGMVDDSNQDTLKPLIDGGTEGEIALVAPVYSVLDRAAVLTVARLQGSNPRRISHNHRLHRVPARPIYPESRRSPLHPRHNTTATGALYRMGAHHCVGSGEAIPEPGQG